MASPDLADKLNKQIEENVRLTKRVKELETLISDYVVATDKTEDRIVGSIIVHYPEIALKDRIADAKKSAEDRRFQLRVSEIVYRILDDKKEAEAKNPPRGGIKC